MRLTTLLLLLGILSCLAPRETQQAPKRELRGVWVATFANLDWPSQQGLSKEVQQQEFRALLDRIEATGFNAVFVQVRPSGDAFYNSSFEPWSVYLTGTQGQDPGYDVMAFMVEEAHKRHLEFHAWLNPFRAVSHNRFSQITSDHISTRYPEWFFDHGNTRYFDPGVPAVRDYLSCVVLDVAQRYDIDGVHFDDYFYPYPDPKIAIKDKQTFTQYKTNDETLGPWRRSNINAFVQQIGDSLKKHAPRVKFGVSPPAVWRNKREDKYGSETQADLTSYDGLYADSRQWLQQGWVDYLAPQCYHHHRYSKARFPSLVDWWNDNTFGRHVYIGLAGYKVKEGKWPAWRRKEEVPNQISLTRDYPNIQGSMLYRAGSLQGNPQKLESQLRNALFSHKALPPVMPWKDDVPPDSPTGLHLAGNHLSWRSGPPAYDGEQVAGYAIYRFPEGVKVDISNPKYLIARVQKPEFDDDMLADMPRTFAVTALDRLHNESSPAILSFPAK